MKEIFLKNGIPISEKQCESLEIYYRLLCDWNKKINLTAITEYRDVVRKHFLDSALLMNCGILDKSSSFHIMDVGTGAGFPGMVLAIFCPDCHFTLLDSLKKRVDFLSVVIKELGLANVTVFHGRAEDFGRNPEFRNQFDLVVSRAVAGLPILLEYCIPFVKRNGYFISYKGKKCESEIQEAENAMKELQCGVKKLERFEPDGWRMVRYLAVFENYSITDERYPRKAGKPEKRPL